MNATSGLGTTVQSVWSGTGAAWGSPSTGMAPACGRCVHSACHAGVGARAPQQPTPARPPSPCVCGRHAPATAPCRRVDDRGRDRGERREDGREERGGRDDRGVRGEDRGRRDRSRSRERRRDDERDRDRDRRRCAALCVVRFMCCGAEHAHFVFLGPAWRDRRNHVHNSAAWARLHWLQQLVQPWR